MNGRNMGAGQETVLNKISRPEHADSDDKGSDKLLNFYIESEFIYAEHHKKYLPKQFLITL